MHFYVKHFFNSHPYQRTSPSSQIDDDDFVNFCCLLRKHKQNIKRDGNLAMKFFFTLNELASSKCKIQNSKINQSRGYFKNKL